MKLKNTFVAALLIGMTTFSATGWAEALIHVPLKPYPAPTPNSTKIETSLLFGQGSGPWGAPSAPAPQGSSPAYEGSAPLGQAPAGAAPLIGAPGTTASAPAAGPAAAPPAAVYQTMAQAAKAGIDPFGKKQGSASSHPLATSATHLQASPPLSTSPKYPAWSDWRGWLNVAKHFFNDSTHIAMFLGGALALSWLLSARSKRVLGR